MQPPPATAVQTESPAAAAMPEIVRRIAAALDPQAIIVFGSVARGTAGPHSDVDLLVIDDFEAQRRSRDGSLTLVYQALRGVRVAVDVLVFSPAEWRRWADCEPHIIGVCAREGRVVHGKL